MREREGEGGKGRKVIFSSVNSDCLAYPSEDSSPELLLLVWRDPSPVVPEPLPLVPCDGGLAGGPPLDEGEAYPTKSGHTRKQ